MLNYFTTNYETKKFIEKYLDEQGCSTRNPKAIEKLWYEITADLNGSDVNADHIASYIKKYLSYENYSSKFLQTLYWVIVSDWVKLLANFKCKMFTAHNAESLVTHHPNYNEIHGYEIQDVHLLVCLCKVCHDKFHDKYNNITPVVMVRNEEKSLFGNNDDNNIFKTPIITQKYIGYQLSVLNYYKSKIKLQIKV